MKKTVAILFAFLPIVVFGQIFPEVSDYVGDNIKEIKEIGYYSRFKKNGWITKTTFSENSLPFNKTNFYKGEKRSNYYFSFIESDSTYKTIKFDSLALNEDAYESMKVYFDKFKNVQKVEIFPDFIESNIKRDTVNRIISYTRRVPSSEFEFTYNRQNQVESVIEIYADNTLRKIYKFKYNNKGEISDIVVDHDNPEVVLSGVRLYSKDRTDKYQYKYKYDKHGNWIKRYSVTKNWKYLNAKRNIVYNNNR